MAEDSRPIEITNEEREKSRIARRLYNREYMRRYREQSKKEGRTNLDDNSVRYWAKKYDEMKERGEV